MTGRDLVARKKAPAGDFYATPRWAVHSLLANEVFWGNILEPASGRGRIVRVLRRHYPERTIRGFDIRTDKNICGGKGIDFLKWNPKSTINNIITNPPYRLALQFAKHALEIVDKKVALLLRLTFLESARRYEFFKNSPLSAVYVFSSRLTMYPAGTKRPKNTGTAAYAWFLWNKDEPNREPVIRWIAPMKGR